MEQVVNILIADDHLLFAKLLKHELNSEPGFNVVGILDNGPDIIETIERDNVDVLLLDIHLNQSNGIAILEEIRGIHPKLKIIMQTFETGGAIVKKVIELGANGFITKFSDSDDIKKSIHAVLKGETYLCKLSYDNLMTTMNQGIINNSRNSTPSKMNSQMLSYDKISDMGFDDNKQQSSELLSEREKEILKLIVKDKSSKAIADDLSISYRTVETHRRNIFRKLGVRNSLTLMKRIIELDLRFEA